MFIEKYVKVVAMKFEVKSKSNKDLIHIVEYDNGHYQCDCEYYQFKGFGKETCSHITEIENKFKELYRRNKMEYTKIGAAWEKDDKISVKLNNGKWFTMFRNEKKTSEKSPDFNCSMLLEEAKAMGIEDNYVKPEGYTPKPKYNSPYKQVSAHDEEIDINKINF